MKLGQQCSESVSTNKTETQSMTAAEKQTDSAPESRCSGICRVI